MAVVEGEVPVAVGLVGAGGAGSAEGDGLYCWEAGEGVGDVVFEVLVVAHHGGMLLAGCGGVNAAALVGAGLCGARSGGHGLCCLGVWWGSGARRGRVGGVERPAGLDP